MVNRKYKWCHVCGGRIHPSLMNPVMLKSAQWRADLSFMTVTASGNVAKCSNILQDIKTRLQG